MAQALDHSADTDSAIRLPRGVSERAPSIFLDVGDQAAAALSDETADDSLADSAGAACDDADLAVEPSRHVSPVLYIHWYTSSSIY